MGKIIVHHHPAKDGSNPRVDEAKAQLSIAIISAARKAQALKALLTNTDDKAQVRSIESFLDSAKGKLNEVLE